MIVSRPGTASFSTISAPINAQSATVVARPPPIPSPFHCDVWVETWNQNPKPFVWHKTAEQILERSRRLQRRHRRSRPLCHRHNRSRRRLSLRRWNDTIGPTCRGSTAGSALHRSHRALGRTCTVRVPSAGTDRSGATCFRRARSGSPDMADAPWLGPGRQYPHQRQRSSVNREPG